MGVDLTLLPLRGASNLSRSAIELNRCDELWQKIHEQPSHVCGEIHCYLATDANGEVCFGGVSNDPYGEPLTCVLAGHLRDIQNHPSVVEDERNRAAWAYIAQLDARTRIALFWN